MPDHPSSELEGVFNRPFTEQVAFFRRKLKNLVPTQRWDDIEREAHDDAFMVAGAAKADLLTDLGAAVDKAISEGRGIEEFRRDFRDIVKRNGWTGWTGEGSVKGEAWRVGVIYRTNAYTSYAAGRMAQLKASNFKFWVYRHGGSREPRPEHLSWDGLILEPDRPFWQTRYPPSDWGCSCYVVGAHTKTGAKLMGGDPDLRLPANWDATDPKTGAPVGVGRGWDYAPGASASDAVNALAGKIRHWDYAIAKAFMDELPTGRADALADAYRALPSTADDVRRYAQRVLEPKPDLAALPPVRTLGRLRSDQESTIGALKDGADVGGFDFVIDEQLTRHILNRHGPSSRDGTPVDPGDFAALPAIVSHPDAIEAARDSALGNLRRVLIRRVIGGREYETVWEIRGGRKSLYLKSFYVVRDVTE